MALSTTFTQCTQATTKIGKITLNKSHFAVQGHRFWYQSKAHIQLTDALYKSTFTITITSYLAPFQRYSMPLLNFYYNYI